MHLEKKEIIKELYEMDFCEAEGVFIGEVHLSNTYAIYLHYILDKKCGWLEIDNAYNDMVVPLEIPDFETLKKLVKNFEVSFNSIYG